MQTSLRYRFQLLGKPQVELIYEEGSNHQAFENTSHICNYMEFSYMNKLDVLMQFSFYITFEYESNNMSYITAAYNDVRFRATTYQSIIHYIHRPYLPVHSRYMVILSSHDLQDELIGLLTNLYYISISSAPDCKQGKNYRFIITGRPKTFRKAFRTNLQMDIYLWFQGSNVYFKSMYHSLTIETSGSPPCDLILNFQLLFTMKTNKSEDNCDIRYLQVSNFNRFNLP